MELYAVRHGETHFNREGRMTGRDGDSSLTEKGIRQAEKLGESLGNIDFDAVYSSPLGRAVQTVRTVLRGRYPVVTDERLAEIGLGLMHGMRYEEASRVFPEAGMLFMTDPAVYKPPSGGETLTDLLGRVADFLRELSETQYEKVFVSTHGYVLRVLYACTEDCSVAALARAPSFGNCELVHFTNDIGGWRLC